MEVSMFFNKRRNQIRLLVYDTGGLVLLSKKLEQGTYEVIKTSGDSTKFTINWTQLTCVLQGIKLRSIRYRKRYKIVENNFAESRNIPTLREEQRRRNSIIITRNSWVQKENAYLRAEIAQLKRLIFGKKSERFISEEKPFPPGTLFSEVVPEENKLENLTEQISYERTKPVHRKGGAKNCRHIYFVNIEVIEPEDKKDTDRRMGLLVTEELEYTLVYFM